MDWQVVWLVDGAFGAIVALGWRQWFWCLICVPLVRQLPRSRCWRQMQQGLLGQVGFLCRQFWCWKGERSKKFGWCLGWCFVFCCLSLRLFEMMFQVEILHVFCSIVGYNTSSANGSSSISFVDRACEQRTCRLKHCFYGWVYHLSNEQKPGCLGYIGLYHPVNMRIMIDHCKDPY